MPHCGCRHDEQAAIQVEIGLPPFDSLPLVQKGQNRLEDGVNVLFVLLVKINGLGIWP